jgi:hypothetical protein
MQIDYVVDPAVLFHPDYPYRSGITETLAMNLQNTGKQLVEYLQLKNGSLVVDLGSNDGTLLQGFKSHGMNVLGVEPTDIAEIAIQNGIRTIQKFFGSDVAEEIKDDHGEVSVVTAANTFAHVAQLGDLVRGVESMLVDGGMFVSESHYILDLLQTVQYDAIYHEHLKYYSLKSILKLFSYYDFTVVDAERIPNYGGSIRVYARKGKGHQVADRMRHLLTDEQRAGLDDSQTYLDFRDKVIQSKIDLQSLIVDLTKQGKRVVGIGCPGRASTLLNYCNIDSVLMPYIAEQSTSLKLGLFLPGQHIPIVDERIIFEESVENALLLSWHYATPIIEKLRTKGLRSKIIIPLPDVRFSQR